MANETVLCFFYTDIKLIIFLIIRVQGQAGLTKIHLDLAPLHELNHVPLKILCMVKPPCCINLMAQLLPHFEC